MRNISLPGLITTGTSLIRKPVSSIRRIRTVKFIEGVGLSGILVVWVLDDYYDENNGYIYRWDVQHNIGDLVSLIGGNEVL